MRHLTILTIVLGSLAPAMEAEAQLFRRRRGSCSTGTCYTPTVVTASRPVTITAPVAPELAVNSGTSVDLRFKKSSVREVDVEQIKEDLLAIMRSDPTFRGEPGMDGQDGRAGQDGLDGPTGPPGESGEQGAPGEDGVNGMNGMDGAPGQVSPEDIAAVISGVVDHMQNDPDFRQTLIQAVTAEIRNNTPTDRTVTHAVLVAKRGAANWPYVESYYREAAEIYHKLDLAVPPGDKDFGVMPQLVLYRNSIPVQRWFGEREVIEQLRKMSDGRFQ